jgi:hypothetical protein
MKTIIEALVRMAPGQFDMKEVAAECGGDVTPIACGREARRLNLRIVDGVVVKVIKIGYRTLVSLHNDERRHPYQRGRALITGLGLWSGKIIETGRLVGVALARLVMLFGFSLLPACTSLLPIYLSNVNGAI